MFTTGCATASYIGMACEVVNTRKNASLSRDIIGHVILGMALSCTVVILNENTQDPPKQRTTEPAHTRMNPPEKEALMMGQ